MRFVYFIYFILKSDYKGVKHALSCLKSRYNVVYLIFDALWSAFYYGTSLDDYFSFRFYEKNLKDRNEFASTAYMYKFHKSLNDSAYIARVDNKAEFRKNFKHLSGPSQVFKVQSSEEIQDLVNWIRTNNYHQVVVKDPVGTTGTSIYFADFNNETGLFKIKDQWLHPKEFCDKIAINGNIYIEPRLLQHPLIQRLAPSALNTIRIITVLTPDKQVDIISAAFRISISGDTDNFSTGNLAAAIDISTGKVNTPGIKRMAACSSIYEKHPVTGIRIIDFQIPMWEKVVEIVKEAAVIIPEVRTVGWDVAILADKVIIIEGNPKWNKGAPQIPLNKGIKPILEKYL